MRDASDLFDEDIAGALDIDAIVAARTTEGGTAPEAVEAQMEQAFTALADDEAAVAGLSPVVSMGAGA